MMFCSKVDWLIGKLSDTSLSLGTRLPLQRAVMKSFLSIQLLNSLTPVKDIFNVIVVELKEIWGRAAIPVKDDKNILKALMNNHDAWLSLKNIPISRRDSRHSKKLIEEFQKQMNSSFNISPSDVENRLRATRKRHWKEDFSFLIGQRPNPKIGFMEKVDQQEHKRQNKKKQTKSPSKQNSFSSKFKSKSRKRILVPQQ